MQLPRRTYLHALLLALACRPALAIPKHVSDLPSPEGAQGRLLSRSGEPVYESLQRRGDPSPEANPGAGPEASADNSADNSQTLSAKLDKLGVKQIVNDAALSDSCSIPRLSKFVTEVEAGKVLQLKSYKNNNVYIFSLTETEVGIFVSDKNNPGNLLVGTRMDTKTANAQNQQEFLTAVRENAKGMKAPQAWVILPQYLSLRAEAAHGQVLDVVKMVTDLGIGQVGCMARPRMVVSAADKKQPKDAMWMRSNGVLCAPKLGYVFSDGEEGTSGGDWLQGPTQAGGRKRKADVAAPGGRRPRAKKSRQEDEASAVGLENDPAGTPAASSKSDQGQGKAGTPGPS